MGEIIYRDRAAQELKKERIYGKFFLEVLYGATFLSRLCALIFLPPIAHIPFFSSLYGKRQKQKKSQKKITPFIRDFDLDVSEFAEPVSHFDSFNAFFIRKLKPEARPIAIGEDVAVFPADGRHLVFPDLSKVEGFYVKGNQLNLRHLLREETLFHLYEKGAMVISRLCPSDYHRFHFPCACVPKETKLINGSLFSVNPLALKKHLSILSENKRVLTPLETRCFGQVLYIEVGATCVGSIQQTFTPYRSYGKGEEKGYFEFGGSCVILLFQPHVIAFDQDLIKASKEQIETYAKMGTSLGRAR